MIRDAIQYIENLVEKSRLTHEVTPHGAESWYRKWLHPDGTLTEEIIPSFPSFRAETIDGFMGLVAQVMDERSGLACCAEEWIPAIFCESHNLTFVVCATHRSTIEMTLPYSAVMAALMVCNNSYMHQKRLCQWMAVDLGLHADVIEPFRTYRIQTSEEAHGTQTSRRESIGKSVTRDLATPELPDSVSVTTEFYNVADLPCEVTVKLDIRLDLENESFCVQPFAGELDRARRDAIWQLTQVMDARAKSMFPPVDNDPTIKVLAGSVGL